MTNAIEFSSITQIHPSLESPSRWLDCPRKSTVIDGIYQSMNFSVVRSIRFFLETFLAFKTPLDERYNKGMPPGKRWTCKMLLKYMETNEV